MKRQLCRTRGEISNADFGSNGTIDCRPNAGQFGAGLGRIGHRVLLRFFDIHDRHHGLRFVRETNLYTESRLCVKTNGEVC